jgi:ribosomal protein L11 methylase PrmA
VRHAAAIGAHARRVIASGLLATERDRVAEAFAPSGYDVADERRGAEWAALLLARSRAAAAG